MSAAAGRRRRTLLRLEDYVPYRLSVAAPAVATLIAEACQRRFQLPMAQWRVLAILSQYRQMRQQDLVPLSTMDKQTVSRAARSLLARGLLSRRVHRDDARAWTLRLSPAGRRLYGKLAPLALHYEQELLRGLSGRERAALLRSLRRLQRVAEERLVRRDGAAAQPPGQRMPPKQAYLISV